MFTSQWLSSIAGRGERRSGVPRGEETERTYPTMYERVVSQVLTTESGVSFRSSISNRCRLAMAGHHRRLLLPCQPSRRRLPGQTSIRQEVGETHGDDGNLVSFYESGGCFSGYREDKERAARVW